MKINNLFFIVVLTVLCLSLGAVSATDVDDVTSIDTTDVMSIQDVDEEIIEDSVDSAKLANMDDSDDMNIKSSQSESLSTSGVYNVNNANWDDIFTTDKKLNIADYSTINFTSDVYRNNNKIYTIDKAVTINGNGFTLNLDTISGSYSGNETGSAFTINTNGSGTTVNDLKFYNTQVFVRNASNVILDNINVTVENQRIGSGVGVTSIRDYSHNVTVRNSYFRTKNNDGSSTLVLAGADNCVLDNNVIIGEGNVGNLLYLTTYNINGVPEDDTNVNSYNNITNNQITGPSSSAICYGITLTGHNNLIANNTINYAGQAITTQWSYTDPVDMSVGNNSEAYTGNNFINNIINNGGSFKGSTANTIKDNTFSGNVIIGNETILFNNEIAGNLEVAKDSKVKDNTIEGNVKVKGSNSILCHNSIFENLTINSGVRNTTLCNNDIFDSFKDKGSSTVNNSSCILCSIPNVNSNSKGLKILKSDLILEPTSLKAVNGANYYANYTLILNGDDFNEGSGISLGSYFKNLGQQSKTRVHVVIILNGNFTGCTFDSNNRGFTADAVIDGTNATLINCVFHVGQGNNMDLKNCHLSYNSLFKEAYIFNYDSSGTPCIVDGALAANDTHWDNVTIDGNLLFTSNPIKIINFDNGNVTINNLNINLSIDCNFLTTFSNLINFGNVGSYGGGNVKISDSNIKLFLSEITELEDFAILFNLETDNNSLLNSNVTMNVPGYTINWDVTNMPNIIPMKLGNNCILENNIININQFKHDAEGAYPTNFVIMVGNDNAIVGNNITVTSESELGYLYAITMSGKSNNNISDNNFTIVGSKYTSGIYMTGVNYGNNTIANNIINCSSGFAGNTGNEGGIDAGNNKAEDSIYPIVIEDSKYHGGTYSESTITVTGNKILNNTIYASGNNGYGIEQFGGNDTTIANNTIIVTGVTPKAIAFTGTNSLITGNTIIVSGSTNESGTTADYFPAKTNGIYLQASSGVVVSENNIDVVNGSGIATNSYSGLSITDNNISTDQEYAILLKSTTDTTVSDNALKSKNGVGNDAVYSNDESNIIGDNTAPAGSPSVIVAEDINAFYGDEIVVAILKDDKGEVLASKTVTVTIGDENYTVTTNDNGEVVLSIANVPGTYNAVVKFDGDETYDGSEANINVVVNAIPVNLTVSNLVKYYGDSKKLSIVLKDIDGNALASKKVTVDIKGKTYTITTDKNGKATLAINLAKGSYSALVKFDETGYQTVSKNVSVKVVTPIIKAVKTKVKKGKYFQVSFKTYNKKAIKSTKVTMKLKGKTYTVKTNSKGIAKLKLKVKKGTYKVKAAFKSTAKYGKTAKTLKVKVY